MYGYAIEKEINSMINTPLPTGTIYTLLHNLENRNFY
ncbi:helix-turn-helix transcriptional regulator [Acidiplasma cupricumulans]|nr:helix-turn-helix transcriptional regulator [Acidiplasma cupricumulans]